jgi:hypothetical protein
MNEYTYLPDSDYKNIGIKSSVIPSLLTLNNPTQEVVRIDKDGRIFWLGREVTTDDEFRQTMLELHKAFTTR